jgi:hypothetical protein
MSIGGGFGNFRGFLLFFLRDRRICDSAPISSFQRRLEAFYNSEAGHPVTWVFLCALRLDCSPARRASYFSLLVHAHAGACANSEAGPKGAGHGCPESRKSNQKKGHPGERALRVRERVTGFFDSTSCAGEKLAGIRASHPSGFPSPVRRALRGPGLRARAARGARTSCCRFAPVTQ